MVAGVPAAKRARGADGEAKVVDMRSDTVTTPTEAMREAMRTAEVGDDVFGDDMTVKKLEAEAARIFGKPAALFVPTGTMSNLIAIMTHCELRGSEFICGASSHIHIYEQGGSATIAGVHSRTVANQPDGTLALKDIEALVRPVDDHFPTTRLICLESTQNRCGGKVLSTEYMAQVGAFAREKGLKLHLDGARVMNAVAALGIDPATYTAPCHSVSICLSKALGAPVGSVLVGDADFIFKARRTRKALGGGMRQVGVIAAPAYLALTEMPKGLVADHANAKFLHDELKSIEGLDAGPDPESNMVFPKITTDKLDTTVLVSKMAERGILIIPIGDGVTFRCVMHHQVCRADVVAAVAAFRDIMGQ